MVAYLQRRHYRPAAPAAARVPAARPARPGDRALPLSRHRADHHARAARRGVRGLLRRRRTGDEAARTLVMRREPSWFAKRAGPAYDESDAGQRTHAHAVATAVELALTRRARRKGLLGRDSLDRGRGDGHLALRGRAHRRSCDFRSTSSSSIATAARCTSCTSCSRGAWPPRSAPMR